MIELVANDAKLLLCPEIGGAIGGWTRRGTPILRETPEEALHGSNSRVLSCFPLIPFSNRIAWGRFSFGGESFQLDMNFGDHPHTIHGNAWQRAWSVASQSAAEAELILDHDPAHDPTVTGNGCHWPYRYSARLRYVLQPNGLAVTITLTNTDHRAQPVGLGLHPYQPRTPQTQIAFQRGLRVAHGRGLAAGRAVAGRGALGLPPRPRDRRRRRSTTATPPGPGGP